ncbi:MAG TPA: hypothetical protein VKM55_05590 [Candidatus Lokiarchaeia archaeon]|nr:hypothetical protein [Candidatus Lokiarchaeia archaeon]
MLTDAWEKKLVLIWIIILAATTAVMLFLLLTGESSLNFTLIIFLMAVKFLAGFGTVIGITSAIIFVLTKFERLFKGEEHKKNLKALLIFMLLILIVLNVYYGPVKIVQSIIKQGDADTIFDKLLFVYGIVSLFFTLYIHPIWKGDFLAATMPTTGDNIKKGIKSASRGIKKRFFTWRKNYAKAELQQQLGMQEFLKRLRQHLAVIVLPFLGVGNIVFTIICAIFIVIWLRIFVFKDRKLEKIEFIFLACACIGISVIAVLLPFVFDATPLYTTIRAGYFGMYIVNFAGLLIASIIYLRKMLGPVMEKRKKAQIKEKKAEQKEVEKEQKAQLKESKKVAKQKGSEKEQPAPKESKKKKLSKSNEDDE